MINKQGFPGGSVVKNLSANAGDMGIDPMGIDMGIDVGRFHILQSN